MSRSGIIQGLVDELQQTNGFDAVSSGTALAYDHRPLGSGVDRAAIVLANRGELARLAMGLNEATWHLDVEVYIRHNNDIVQARQDADVYVGNIITQVNNNPTLGGSAWDALVVESRLEDERMLVNKRPFLLEVLTVRCKEQYVV